MAGLLASGSLYQRQRSVRRRQEHREGAAAADGAFYRDPAAVRLGDALGDRQAQPAPALGAAAPAIKPKEAVE